MLLKIFTNESATMEKALPMNYCIFIFFLVSPSPSSGSEGRRSNVSTAFRSAFSVTQNEFESRENAGENETARCGESPVIENEPRENSFETGSAVDGNEDNKNNEEEETLSHNEKKNDRDLPKMKAQGKHLQILFKISFQL